MTDSRSFDKPSSGRFFIKMHGLLNHFVIVDGRDEAFSPSAEEIIRICDQKTGVGGDQLIIIEKPSEKGCSAGAAVFMRILNVDAREVEACGNATRCVAWLLMEEAGSDQVTIETLAGLIVCKRTGDHEVSCEMGRISMDWQKVPLAEPMDTCHMDVGLGPLSDGVALNVGNPHIVYFVDDIDAIDIKELAPVIQKHKLFPDEVNVGIVQMMSDHHLRSVVYERGAGLTTACGSGACAAAYAALERGLTKERKVTVSMPAGDVQIAIDADGIATMTGPVAYCFTGNL